MPSPFPGMDPYLETADLWPDVHHELLSQIRSALNPELRPRYVARVELRVYVSDDDDPGREALVPDLRIEKPKRSGASKPKRAKAVAVAESLMVPFLIDDEVKEARLEIRHRESGSRVTIIEVLSPTNKIRGARGRTSFMEKRRETLASEVHWVEIAAGEHAHDFFSREELAALPGGGGRGRARPLGQIVGRTPSCIPARHAPSARRSGAIRDRCRRAP